MITLYDINAENDAVQRDKTLETALRISLFSDRRVGFDITPPSKGDRRGWWADNILETDEPIGSRLWTLARERVNNNTLTKARDYCTEALQWLITDGVAEIFSINTERRGLYGIAIKIVISRPDTDKTDKYFFNWEAQAEAT